jgi:hypothetical protein
MQLAAARPEHRFENAFQQLAPLAKTTLPSLRD